MFAERGRHAKPRAPTKLEIGLLSASMLIAGVGIEQASSIKHEKRPACSGDCYQALGALANMGDVTETVQVPPRQITLSELTTHRSTVRPKPIAKLKPRPRPSPEALKPSLAPRTTLQMTVAQPTDAGRLGNDASYPDCPRILPKGQLFAIVGINHGKPGTTNDCLSREMRWAKTSATNEEHSKVAFYLNTANPGSGNGSWPNNNTDPRDRAIADPYGHCRSGETPACAWQYGWNEVIDDIDSRFKPAARSAGISTQADKYSWWLDVETPNAWEKDSAAGQARDAAVLQGMTSALHTDNIDEGVYSTGYQWGKIVGDSELKNLAGLPEWIPGAGNRQDALAHCNSTPFTAGAKIIMAQFTTAIDYDVPCPR